MSTNPYSAELKKFKANITINVRSDDDNATFNNIYNYIDNLNGKVNLLDLNNTTDVDKFQKNITEATIMKSLILNDNYYKENIGITNPHYEFIKNNKPWAMYFAEDYVAGDNKLYDCSGNGRHATTSCTGTSTINKSTASGKGAINSINYLSGDSNCKIDFPDGSIPSQFTIASITKYADTTTITNTRILQGKNTNWYHGHSANVKNTYYYGTTTSTPSIVNYTYNTNPNKDDWCIAVNNNKTSNYKGNDNLTINNSNVKGNWCFACLIIWENNSVVVDDVQKLLVSFLSTSGMTKNLFLIKDTNLIKPSKALYTHDTFDKYNFLLIILTQLYEQFIQFKNDTEPERKNNLLKNGLTFNFTQQDGSEIILTTSNLLNATTETTTFVNDINNDTNHSSKTTYNTYFINIKSTFINHLDLIKKNDMFQVESYWYYYTTCASIYINSANILSDLYGAITSPYQTIQPRLCNTSFPQVQQINNSFSYFSFTETDVVYYINVLNPITCDILLVGGGAGGTNYTSNSNGGDGGTPNYIESKYLAPGLYEIKIGRGGDSNNPGIQTSVKHLKNLIPDIVAEGGTNTLRPKSSGEKGGGKNRQANTAAGIPANTVGSEGKDGISYIITGTSICYGSGGGGGSSINGLTTPGGRESGGNGGTKNAPNSNGRKNMGGGGGGGSEFSFNGASGGSGVVIIKINNSDISKITCSQNYKNVLNTTTYNSIGNGLNNLVIDNQNNNFIRNYMIEIGDINKNIRKINMDINRSNNKYTEQSKIINSSYIELLAIALLVILIIIYIYLVSVNDNITIIKFSTISVCAFVLIYLIIYFTYLRNIINENFDVQYANNNYIILFEKINLLIGKNQIYTVTNLSNIPLQQEKNRYKKYLDIQSTNSKNSLNQLNIVSLENKKTAYEIHLIFILSILLSMLFIIYGYNNDLLLPLIIIFFTIFVILLYYLYIYQVKNVHVDNSKYYWKKPK